MLRQCAHNVKTMCPQCWKNIFTMSKENAHNEKVPTILNMATMLKQYALNLINNGMCPTSKSINLSPTLTTSYHFSSINILHTHTHIYSALYVHCLVSYSTSNDGIIMVNCDIFHGNLEKWRCSTNYLTNIPITSPKSITIVFGEIIFYLVKSYVK